MHVCVIFILCVLIVPLNADFGIVRQSPNGTVTTFTNSFILEINQTVNRPAFPALIHIYNATSNTSIYQISVLNNMSVTYSNNALTFTLPDTVAFNANDEFYITLDVGVLFSNNSINSTAQTSSNFWHVKVASLQTSTSALTTDYTSMQTTYNMTAVTSMSSNATSTFITTTMMTSSFTSANQTLPTNVTNTTVTTTAKVIQGESPPTRSAQLGMGLGITFIAIIIIIEIVYFKYCYDGDGRSGSYFT